MNILSLIVPPFWPRWLSLPWPSWTALFLLRHGGILFLRGQQDRQAFPQREGGPQRRDYAGSLDGQHHQHHDQKCVALRLLYAAVCSLRHYSDPLVVHVQRVVPPAGCVANVCVTKRVQLLSGSCAAY